MVVNMEDMIPEGALITKRGIQTISIPWKGLVVKVKVKVMTNKEIDELTMKNVIYEDGEPSVDASALTDAAILDGLLDINTTYNGKKYYDLDEEERGEFLNSVEPKLRDSIAKAVMGTNHVIGKERDFL